MGARPLTALNLVAYPGGDDPGPDVLARILQGGVDVLTDAGAALIGGHSVDDPEPKFGMAVTGVVSPDHVLTKAGARPDDVLVLTKPIGVGAATTALKRDLLGSDEIAVATGVMLRLNDQLEALADPGVHAATDVTGFGLLGHLLEVVQASGVGARIACADVPVLPFAPALVAQGIVPAGSRRNLAYVRPHLAVEPPVSEVELQMLADAVTSGGLLLCVDPDRTDAVCAALRRQGALVTAAIGRITAGPPGAIRIGS